MTMLIRIQCEKHDVREREREREGEREREKSEGERERVANEAFFFPLHHARKIYKYA